MPIPPPPFVPVAPPAFDLEPSKMGRGRGVWVGLILLFLLVAIYGCGKLVQSVRAGQEEARALLKDLHLQMIRKDWDGIYAQAGPGYRNAITQQKSEAYFSAIQRKIGNPVSSENDGYQAVANTSGHFLRASFKTTFSLDATGEETITWKKVDGEYRMQSYAVESSELIER